MSAEDLVPLTEALTTLSDAHWAIKELAGELDTDLQLFVDTMRISSQPQDWLADLSRALKDLNWSYRREAKVGIQEGARKFRRQGGLSRLLGEIVSAVRMERDASGLLDQLTRLCSAYHDQINVPDRVSFEQFIHLYTRGIQRIHDEVELLTARYRRTENYIKILDLPSARIRSLTAILSNPVSQRANMLGAQPVLHSLAQSLDRGLELETAARMLATRSFHRLSSNGPYVRRDILEDEVRRLHSIREELLQEKVRQASCIAEARVFSDSASSAPSVLSGTVPGAELSVANLRNVATVEIQALTDGVKFIRDLYIPLSRALHHNIEHLRRLQMASNGDR